MPETRKTYDRSGNRGLATVQRPVAPGGAHSRIREDPSMASKLISPRKVVAAESAADGELAGVIKSAKRVLELFEFFAERRRSLAVTDVVHGLDYPQSSASALLKSLTKLGYLDYDRYRRLYRPTLRVALLGGWVQDDLYSETNLFNLMDELHRRSGGEALMLGMQNDIYVQYIHVVQSPGSELNWYLKPGSLRPLCRSATGRMLLSLKSDVQVQQLLWRVNAEETDPAKRMNIHDLLREINQIRTQKYAMTEGTINPNGGVIAIEMPTPQSQPPMALGIGASLEMLRTDRERLLQLLNDAVRPYR